MKIIIKISFLIIAIIFSFLFPFIYNIYFYKHQEYNSIITILLSVASQFSVILLIIFPKFANKIKLLLLLILLPYIYFLVYILIFTFSISMPVYYHTIYSILLIEYSIFIYFLFKKTFITNNKIYKIYKPVFNVILICIYILIFSSSIKNYIVLCEAKNKSKIKYDKKIKNIQIGMTLSKTKEIMGYPDGTYTFKSINKYSVQEKYVKKIYYGLTFLRFDFVKKIPFINDCFSPDYIFSTNSIILIFEEENENAKLKKIEYNF